MTLPNILTVFRILLIVPMTALFFVPPSWEKLAAFIVLALYIVAGVTDYLDGYLARKNNQLSVFGKILDPIADKLLVGALLFLLVNAGVIKEIHVIAPIIIILRELLISGLREVLAARQIDLPVSKLAKWKTSFQMLSLGFLIPSAFLPFYIGVIGLSCLWLSAGLTLLTGAQYVRLSIRHMTS